MYSEAALRQLTTIWYHIYAKGIFLFSQMKRVAQKQSLAAKLLQGFQLKIPEL